MIRFFSGTKVLLSYWESVKGNWKEKKKNPKTSVKAFSNCTDVYLGCLCQY